MRFYIDTSVFGGVFDNKFKEDTTAFFDYIGESNAELIYSNITIRELEGAPKKVKQLIQELEDVGEIKVKRININDEAEILARNYIEEGALSEQCEEDARHIALASVYGVNALVSWNFKHMVNFIRIQKYNYINLKLGYRSIDIRSPKEIIP